MADTAEHEAREHLADLLPTFRFAMVTSTTADGTLTACPLTVQDTEFDGDLWFIVGRSSSVAEHVAERPHVGVSLSGDSAWVSLAGRGQIVDDPARLKEYWSPAVDAWFPDGPDDPEVTLLRVDALSGEYWSSPGGRVATLVSLVKSRITGEPMEGENAKVDL
jgi:general stress protein 26